MKKALCLLIAAAVALCPFMGAAAEEIEPTVVGVIEDVDIAELLSYYEQYIDESGADIVNKLASGDFSDISAQEALSVVSEKVFAGVKASFGVLLQILCVLLIFMVMRHITSSFESAGAAKAVIYVGYIIICGLLLSAVTSLYSAAAETIGSVTSFFSYVAPVLATLLTALGGYASANVISPAIAMFSGGVTVFVLKVVIPILIIDMVLTVTGGITKNVNLSGFSKLLREIVKWMLGIVFIVFLGIVTVQSMGSGVFDGISIRTAKFTIDKAVPVVGGMFSDSLDTLVACSAVVKNAIGITGLIVICGIIIIPAVNIAANIIMTRIAGAVSGAFSAEGAQGLFEGIGDNLRLLMAAVLTVGIMAFVLISIIMFMGNINLMMR